MESTAARSATAGRNGNMDTAIAIRTAVIKNGELHVRPAAVSLPTRCRRWSGKNHQQAPGDVPRRGAEQSVE